LGKEVCDTPSLEQVTAYCQYLQAKMSAKAQPKQSVNPVSSNPSEDSKVAPTSAPQPSSDNAGSDCDVTKPSSSTTQDQHTAVPSTLPPPSQTFEPIKLLKDTSSRSSSPATHVASRTQSPATVTEGATKQSRVTELGKLPKEATSPSSTRPLALTGTNSNKDRNQSPSSDIANRKPLSASQKTHSTSAHALSSKPAMTSHSSQYFTTSSQSKNTVAPASFPQEGNTNRKPASPMTSHPTSSHHSLDPSRLTADVTSKIRSLDDLPLPSRSNLSVTKSSVQQAPTKLASGSLSPPFSSPARASKPSAQTPQVSGFLLEYLRQIQGEGKPKGEDKGQQPSPSTSSEQRPLTAGAVIKRSKVLSPKLKGAVSILKKPRIKIPSTVQSQIHYQLQQQAKKVPSSSMVAMSQHKPKVIKTTPKEPTSSLRSLKFQQHSQSTFATQFSKSLEKATVEKREENPSKKPRHEEPLDLKSLPGITMTLIEDGGKTARPASEQAYADSVSGASVKETLSQLKLLSRPDLTIQEVVKEQDFSKDTTSGNDGARGKDCTF